MNKKKNQEKKIDCYEFLSAERGAMRTICWQRWMASIERIDECYLPYLKLSRSAGGWRQEGGYERGRLLWRRSSRSWRCIRQHPSFVSFLSLGSFIHSWRLFSSGFAFSTSTLLLLLLLLLFYYILFYVFLLKIGTVPVVRGKSTGTIQLSIKDE